MDVNLVIPRHPHGSNTVRENLNLMPAGKQALDRIATCSRSAAADLAIRLLDAVVFGSCLQLNKVVNELASALDTDGLTITSVGFEEFVEELDDILQRGLVAKIES